MTASRTAQYVAMYRALENDEMRREPLFRDPFAASFLDPSLRRAVRLARVRLLRPALERYADYRAPGARTSAIARTRFIDDVVRRAAREGSRQLVVLGAGFDCRAHRLPELAGSRVFEVDRPETQERKRAELARARGLQPRGDVRYVAVDFLVDDLGERLAAAGWSQGERSTFVWEGVSNYLTDEAVSRLLGWLGRTAPGGCVVFTYIHRGVLDGSERFEGAERLLRNVRTLGEPWRFGLHPDAVASYLAGCGLRLEEDLGADAYRRRHPGLAASGMRGYAFYRIAVARVVGARAASA